MKMIRRFFRRLFNLPDLRILRISRAECTWQMLHLYPKQTFQISSGVWCDARFTAQLVKAYKPDLVEYSS